MQIVKRARSVTLSVVVHLFAPYVHSNRYSDEAFICEHKELSKLFMLRFIWHYAKCISEREYFSHT